MKAQIVAKVILIFVVHAQSLLHHNNIGVTYVETSNFKMEPIRSIPLYYVAMLQSMIIVTKAPFVSTPIHTIVGIKYIPQIPRGTKFVTLHEDIPREVNIIFVNHPSNIARGD
jgi:hypothetical protein